MLQQGLRHLVILNHRKVYPLKKSVFSHNQVRTTMSLNASKQTHALFINGPRWWNPATLSNIAASIYDYNLFVKRLFLRTSSRFRSWPIQSFLFYFRWCFHFKYRYEMPIVFTPLLLRCSSVELNSARRWFCSVSSNSEQLRQLIRTHTEVTRDHMTPEIQLHLITPRCSLWSAKGDDAPFTDPFWAFYWPGGQVLSRYIWLSMFV